MDDIATQHPERLDFDYGPGDIFSEVMEPDKPGHLRTFGLGATATQVFGSTCEKCQVESSNYNARLKEEVEKIWIEVESEMNKKLEAQLNKLRAEMEAKFQAMEFSIPQRNAPYDPLGTTQVADASRAFEMTSPTLHSSPQPVFQPPLNSKAQVEQRKRREEYYSLFSHQLKSNEMQVAKKGKKQQVVNSGNLKKNEVHLLSTKIPKYIVAQALIVSKDPSKMVGGMKLGPKCWEVLITNILKPHEELVHPYGQLKKLNDAL